MGFSLKSHLGCLVALTGGLAHSLSEMLCVKAQLSESSGGLNSTVVFIDGGNCFDPYLIADFSRQYGASIGHVLYGIKVSRAFTAHQLFTLIMERLPQALRLYGSRVVVVSDILRLFNSDLEIGEARELINQALLFLSSLAKERSLVIVATCLRHRCRSVLESYLLSRADIVVETEKSLIYANTLERFVAR